MRRHLGPLCVVLIAVAVPATLTAQQPGKRAWQQRIKVDVPAAVPEVALAPANPFATPVEVPPQVGAALPPHKIDVAGRAVVAVYVDADGRCQGAVPLDLPFPGITASFIEELMSTRFEPARVGRQDVASWLVMEVTLAGKVKESAVVDQSVELPSADAPPAPAPPPAIHPAGRLAALPATPNDRLTATATLRRLRVGIGGREVETAVRALVHLTADGRCDRFVPLEVDSGLLPWLSAFLANWRAQPAQRGGQPVPCWLQYTARIRLKMSSLDSTAARLLPERAFTPAAASPSGASPSAG